MATTLATFLIKLGFDITGLAGGSNAAQGHLNNVAAAAGNITKMAAPAAAALNNLNRAAAAVQGSRGATNSVQSLANAAAAVARNTNQSAPAMAAFARGASAVAAATGSGTALNAYARAIEAISVAGDPTKIRAFATQAANGAALIGSRAGGVQKLVDSFNAARSAAAAAGPAMGNAANAANAAGAAGNNAAAGANNAAGGANNASGAALRASSSFQGMARSMDVAANRGSFLNRVLSMAFAFGGGVAVTTVFGFIASAVVGFNSRLEQSHIAFETLIGDAKSADAFITKMMRFAELSPFDFAGLEDAAQRLMAMGFTADQVLPSLTAIGDAVSALGGGKDKIDRVSLAIGQMITAGRINAQDMRQLTEAGIPAWDILSKAIGKSVAETRKMAENGLIPATQAVEDLLNGMEARFGGLMARQARTAAGAFSTIRDSMLQIISGAVQPAFDAISKGMVALADFLVNGGGQFIAPVIMAIGVAIGMFLIPRIVSMAATMAASQVVIAGFGMTFVWMSRLSAFVALTAIFAAWDQNLGGIRSALEPIIRSIFNFATSVVQAAAAAGLLNAAIIIFAAVLGARLIGQILAMIIGTITLAGSFTGLTVSAGAATVGVSGLAAVMAFLGTTLIPIVLIIGGVVLAVGLLYTAITAVFNLLGITAAGGQKFKSFVELIGEGIDALTAKLRDFSNQKVDTPKLDPFENLDLGGNQFIADSQTLVQRFGVTMQGVVDAAHEAGAKAMSEMAASIRDGAQAPVDAFVALKDALANSLTDTAQVARLTGMLGSWELAQGLASGTPGVRAAAEAMRLSVTEQLDAITDGAFSASLAIGGLLKLQAAMRSFQVQTPQAAVDASRLDALVTETQRSADIWNSRWKPGVDASRQALEKLNAELAKTANSQAASGLSSAFNDIRSSAHRFFDSMHQENLQLIDDALKHKNAILDAKAALNQAPVTAAQKALDFQRRQIQEWRLRQSVATASGPEQQRDAVLALQDFLAQTHIDDMQSEVDAAQAKIDLQKQHNTDRAANQKDAENQRYDAQVAAFDRDLTLLEKSLTDQKMTWQQGQEAILGLLKGYGITFGTVGSQLGGTFVANLKDQIDAAIKALQTMSAGLGGAVNPNTAGINWTGTNPLPPSLMDVPGSQSIGGIGGKSTGTSGVGASVFQNQSFAGKIANIPAFASGNWDVMANQLAMIHKGEMVVPSGYASSMRDIFGGHGSPSGFAKSVGSSIETRSSGSSGPLILKVGEDVFGEITDRRLAAQDDIYGTKRLDLRSQR